jgi:hypothetical protein
LVCGFVPFLGGEKIPVYRFNIVSRYFMSPVNPRFSHFGYFYGPYSLTKENTSKVKTIGRKTLV